MAFATTANIHSLVGNKTIYNSAGTDITTTVLTDAVAKGDSRMLLKTATVAASWSPTDEIYPSLQQAAEYFGAEYILVRYFKDNSFTSSNAIDPSARNIVNGRGLATQYLQKAKEICEDIKNGSSVSAITAHKAYKTFPLNPNGTIWRSLTGNGDSTLEG